MGAGAGAGAAGAAFSFARICWFVLRLISVSSMSCPRPYMKKEPIQDTRKPTPATRMKMPSPAKKPAAKKSAAKKADADEEKPAKKPAEKKPAAKKTAKKTEEG